MTGSRSISYGQRRVFRGLEKHAIEQRLSFAVKAIERQKNTRPPRNLIDLGCGFNASTLVALRERFPDISCHGVDVRINDNLKTNSGLTLVEANIETWAPPAEKYDVVLSLAVVEHLIDPARHFRLIAACLSDKGIGILTTPSPPAHAALYLLTRSGIFDRHECDDHKLYLTGNGMMVCAAAAGLRVVERRFMQFGMNQCFMLARAGKEPGQNNGTRE